MLFPSDCRVCGAPLLNLSRLPVCDTCLGEVRPEGDAGCEICGERLLSAHATVVESPRCGFCQRVEHPFVRAVAVGSYSGATREMVHLLKYDRVLPAARLLGKLLAEQIVRGVPEEVLHAAETVMIPVPLYKARQRERRFNQAEEIAREALRELKRNGQAAKNVQLRPEWLLRKRPTLSQTGLTRAQRIENVRGAFAVPKGTPLRGRHALLVDDVYTTGTTVSECSRVLRRAGAESVWVATAARVYRNEPQRVQEQESPAGTMAGMGTNTSTARGVRAGA